LSGLTGIIRLAARAFVIALVMTAMLAGNMLRLDPMLGVGQSDYAKAIAAETDPVAKLLLVRSHLCNPGDENGKDRLAHEHCEGCCVAPTELPAPKLAFLKQPVERQRTLNALEDEKAPDQLIAFVRPPGRAPPVLA